MHHILDRSSTAVAAAELTRSLCSWRNTGPHALLILYSSPDSILFALCATRCKLFPAVCGALPTDVSRTVQFGSFQCAVLQGRSCLSRCDFGYRRSSSGQPRATCQVDRSWAVDDTCNPTGELGSIRRLTVRCYGSRGRKRCG
jgi:hypothetical protein